MLSFALCDSNRARGNGMELCQGRGSWGLGKGLPSGVGMEQAVQGSGHGPECFGAFEQCSQTQGLDFGWSCVEPGV